MQLELKKDIKNPTIIEGVPGFGLVGAIATEYLINHLKTELVGRLWFEQDSPNVIVHEGKMVYPLEAHYNAEYNVLIIHVIGVKITQEWEIADLVADIAKKTKAKQVISLEGVSSLSQIKNQNVFYYSNSPDATKRFSSVGIEKLKEGIIMGVTSALMMKLKECPLSALFVETNLGFPDSKAAAKLIEVLDKILHIDVDYKPLLKTAEEFESKIKKFISQKAEAEKAKEKTNLSYLG